MTGRLDPVAESAAGCTGSSANLIEPGCGARWWWADVDRMSVDEQVQHGHYGVEEDDGDHEAPGEPGL